MQFLKLRTFENADDRMIMIVLTQTRSQIWQHQKCNETLMQFLKNNKSEFDNHFQNAVNEYDEKNELNETFLTLLKTLNSIKNHHMHDSDMLWKQWNEIKKIDKTLKKLIIIIYDSQWRFFFISSNQNLIRWVYYIQSNIQIWENQIFWLEIKYFTK